MRIITLIITILDLGIGLILLNGIIRKKYDEEGNLGAGFMSILLFLSGLLLVSK